MRYRKLGKTDLTVSELVVGTWVIGGTDWGDTSGDDGMEAIHTMLDQGVNFIDTAPTYGFGESERRVGLAVKEKRQDVILQTKCGVYWPGGKKDHKSGSKKDSSRATILRQCDESLQLLGTDYIDIYMIHWPDVNTPFEESADALKELKKAGKIRYAGVSNFSVEQLEEFNRYGILDVVQYGYSMVDQAAAPQLKWCEEHGVATESYGTLGAGILTGKLRQHKEYDASDARGRFYKFFNEPAFSQVMKLLDVMDRIAEERNVPLSQIAINWNLQKSYMDTVLCGVRNVRQAMENCQAMDWMLTEEEVRILDEKISLLEL